ncbi:hypothetical protein DFH06DRAFT_1342623 [Mycena polygramma]|nr:hypothetical protein DFH06DRAFT_1342623 [Mycena polygramma]
MLPDISDPGADMDRHFIKCPSRMHKRFAHYFRRGELSKRDCIKVGGCPCHRRSTAAPANLSFPGTLPDFSALQRFVNAPTNQWTAAAQAQMHAHQAQLDLLALLTPLPPSPTASQELEYASFESSPSPPRRQPSSPPAYSSTHSKHTSRASSSIVPSTSTVSLSSTPTTATPLCDIVLFYWPTNGPAIVQAIQDPAWRSNWPRVPLRELAHLLVTDDHPEVDEAYQCFSTDYLTWMEISLNYKVTVSVNSPVFIRRFGVEGADEAKHLPTISTSVTSHPLKRQRLGSDDYDGKGKGKGKERVIEVDDSSDDDVVVVDGPTVKKEPAAKRPRLTVSIPPALPALSHSASTVPSTPLHSPSSSSSSSSFPPYIFPSSKHYYS